MRDLVTSLVSIATILGWFGVACGPAFAGDGSVWYVAPQGRADNPGTADAPLDLASALVDEERIAPGDTICLLGGVYRRRPNELFDIRLRGTAESPILVSPAPGQHAQIDGGLSVQSPSAHVWVRNLEIFVSESLPEESTGGGADSRAIKRPHGGLHMFGGHDCKYINLVIHHCNQGICCWKDELNPEIYGCVIFANGWTGEDPGPGHGICTQNNEGVKTISNCIVSCSLDGSCTVLAYGPGQAFVNNYLFTENICYGKGLFLVGGGRPSQGIRLLQNYIHNIDVKIGYNAPYNEDCEIWGNVVVNGKLEAARYRNVTWDRNIILPRSRTPRSGLDESILLRNKYDANRLHLAIFNWGGAGLVRVDTLGFMGEGDTAELYEPENLFGNPVAKVVCNQGAIQVPVGREFAAFVVKLTRW